MNKSISRVQMLVVVLISTLGIAGCSTVKTRVFPKDNGTYQMVASSYHSESDAYDGALEKANEYCLERGKSFVMIDQKSEYTGLDKNVKAVAGVADSILATASGPNRSMGIPGLYGATHSQDDNKVTMNFKCQ